MYRALTYLLNDGSAIMSDREDKRSPQDVIEAGSIFPTDNPDNGTISDRAERQRQIREAGPLWDIERTEFRMFAQPLITAAHCGKMVIVADDDKEFTAADALADFLG